MSFLVGFRTPFDRPYGGKLVGSDAGAVAAMRGVKHVLRVDDETVAVVAGSFWRAKTALDALPVTWDEGPGAAVSSATIAETLREGLSADTLYIGNRTGDAKGTLAKAGRVIEADYSYPYQNHTPMEVLSATVRWTPWPRRWACRWRPARCTRCASAAASAGGSPPTTCGWPC